MTDRHILLEDRMSGYSGRCPSCKGPAHPRIHQASPVRPIPGVGPSIDTRGLPVDENWTWGKIVGGVFVLLLLFGAIAYGGPVIAEWLGMGR